MGYILILVGIGLIGFYFYGLDGNSGGAPRSHPSKFMFGGIGVGCFLLAAYLLYSVSEVWEYSAWKAFVYLVFTVSLAIAGGNLVKAAYEADQKEAADMEARARAKAQEAEHRRKEIELEDARIKAKKDEELADERRRTEAALLRNQRMETNLRSNLAEAAEEQGVDVNSLINQNNYTNQKSVDLKIYAKEKEIDYHFREKDKRLEIQLEKEAAFNQLEAADRVEHYDIIENLDEKLKKLLRERRDVELNEKDEWLKEKTLALLDKRISQVEADIDGRQNRLLSSSDGKETKRLT